MHFSAILCLAMTQGMDETMAPVVNKSGNNDIHGILRGWTLDASNISLAFPSAATAIALGTVA
jgi:hypothetical protein